MNFMQKHWPAIIGTVGVVYYGSGMLFYMLTHGHSGIALDQGWDNFALSAGLIGLNVKHHQNAAKINCEPVGIAMVPDGME